MPRQTLSWMRVRQFTHIRETLEDRRLRSHKGPGGRTKAQLYQVAKSRGVDGRSYMTKGQLEEAVSRT